MIFKLMSLYRPMLLLDANDDSGSGGPGSNDPDPEAGASGGNPNDPQDGSGGSGGDDSDKVAKAYEKLRLSEEKRNQAEREAERLRKEKEKREAEERSDLENAQKKIEDLERAAQEKDERLRKANLRTELRDPKHEIAPDAVNLVAGALEVTFDDEGQPENVDAAVKAFLDTHPSLRKKAGSGGGGSPANPAGGRGGPGELSHDEAVALAKSDPDRFNELFDKGEIPKSALGG